MTPPEIPDALRAEAKILGLPDDLIGLKWIEHCQWVDRERPGNDYGGSAWAKFVRAIVADLNERKTAQQIRDERAAREFAQEQARKRNDDLLYRQQAVTLPEWIAMLRRRLDAGDVLPDHERRIAETSFVMLDGDHPVTWLLDALSPQRTAP